MTELRGYAGKVLRIDLGKKEIKTSELERDMAASFLGGRGFNSKRLYDEVNPGIDPLGVDNKLFFSSGPLVGTMFPTASRFNVWPSRHSQVYWVTAMLVAISRQS